MDDEPEVTQEGDVGGSGGRAPRPRGPVTGGWGFDDDTGGPRMSAEPPSPQRGHKGHFEEDDDAVPTIPDLEEEAEEDITRQVAAPPIAAPSLAAPVRTVRELDGALISRGTQLPTTPEEGVDLAPLMQCLCSDRQVFEQDSTWDHELIFQEVASAINQDLLTVEEGEVEESRPLCYLFVFSGLCSFGSGCICLSPMTSVISLADVVVIDRAKYAGNVGSILRHMPILGGAQILFLANSAHQPSSPYPPYPRSFIKEVMRVSMLQHYREFEGKFCLLDGGRDAVFQLLAILKSKGFVLMILENVEAFQEMSTDELSCILPHEGNG
eukprot:s1439_g3.t3